MWNAAGNSVRPCVDVFFLFFRKMKSRKKNEGTQAPSFLLSDVTVRSVSVLPDVFCADKAEGFFGLVLIQHDAVPALFLTGEETQIIHRGLDL